MKNFSIIYSFRNSQNNQKPILEGFSVSLMTKEAKLAKRLMTKIQPPAGYEHISLEPPEFKPSSADENAQGPFPEPKRNNLRETIRPSTSKGLVIKKNSITFPWWTVGGLLAILMIIMTVWLKFRKSKSSL